MFTGSCSLSGYNVRLRAAPQETHAAHAWHCRVGALLLKGVWQEAVSTIMQPRGDAEADEVSEARRLYCDHGALGGAAVTRHRVCACDPSLEVLMMHEAWSSEGASYRISRLIIDHYTGTEACGPDSLAANVVVCQCFLQRPEIFPYAR